MFPNASQCLELKNQIFIQEKNDAFANDANETIDPETLEGYKEMGAFGLQVIFINLCYVY